MSKTLTTKPDTPWWLAKVRFLGGRCGSLKYQAANLAEARNKLINRSSVASILSVTPLPR